MLLAIAGIVFGLTGMPVPAYIAAILCSAGLFFISGRQPAGYSSATAIFIVFFMAYGLIAPFGELTGAPVLLSRPYLTDFFLAQYSLACIGLILAISLCGARRWPDIAFDTSTGPNVAALLATGIVFGACATLFEIVNVMRAGGLHSILSSDLARQGGKLAYQSAITSLTGTLPSTFAVRAAFAMMALAIGLSKLMTGKWPVRSIMLFGAVVLPVVASYIYLGRRSELLALILIAFVAGFWSRPVRKLSVRLILAVGFLYLIFVVVLILRETVFHPAGAQLGSDQFFALILHALLPSSGEFGAPLGVFSEYLKSGQGTALLWGGSYLDGFSLMVPGFLFPGEKPVQIDAAFFASLFAGKSDVPGGIAGYGFSPILEAYLNFASIGVAAVFFVIGCCLCFLERARATNNGFLPILFYLMILPLGQMFHRSTFGNAILSPGLWICVTVVMAFPVYRLAVWFVRRTSADAV